MASGLGAAFDSDNAKSLGWLDCAINRPGRHCAALGERAQTDSGCPGLRYVVGFESEQVDNAAQNAIACVR
jgi:hypothetical protein